ncbi:hypothetical protein Micbo1qcDRAFT_52746 [Microdochium bolleyi]|uniref:Uncharacterized protein n=1 Tax=Microdochium bolleyi TaxID=196109 RepID=A0A136J783_9PEZI|nr:hypothetical protein Micbo1qcDRAFT_52746 [Microdochium bolleyi]
MFKTSNPTCRKATVQKCRETYLNLPVTRRYPRPHLEVSTDVFRYDTVKLGSWRGARSQIAPTPHAVDPRSAERSFASLDKTKAPRTAQPVQQEPSPVLQQVCEVSDERRLHGQCGFQNVQGTSYYAHLRQWATNIKEKMDSLLSYLGHLYTSRELSSVPPFEQPQSTSGRSFDRTQAWPPTSLNSASRSSSCNNSCASSLFSSYSLSTSTSTVSPGLPEYGNDHQYIIDADRDIVMTEASLPDTSNDLYHYYYGGSTAVDEDGDVHMVGGYTRYDPGTLDAACEYIIATKGAKDQANRGSSRGGPKKRSGKKKPQKKK